MHTYKCVVIKCSVQHNVEKESALVTDEIFILKLFLKLGLDESTSGPQGKNEMLWLIDLSLFCSPTQLGCSVNKWKQI